MVNTCEISGCHIEQKFQIEIILKVLGIFDFILPVKCTGIDTDLNWFNKKINQKNVKYGEFTPI